MKVLVTGGAGFIGSHVVAELLRSGYDVGVVDDLSSGKAEYVPKSCPLYTIDVASEDFVDVVCREKPAAIIHLAAQISVSVSTQNPTEDARVNIWGSLNVLRAAHASGCRKIVYSSSAAVYGNPQQLPLQETSPLRPLSPYGVSKRAAEDYFLADAWASDLSVTVLRFGNVYGPRQAVSAECGVVTIFVQALIDERNPVVFGDGTATRDYVYVVDVAKAVSRALEQEGTIVCNISSGVETSVTHLWDMLQEISGLNLPSKHGPERRGDIYRSVLDPSLAQDLLGWHAGTTLPIGLSKTLEYYRGLRGGIRC